MQPNCHIKVSKYSQQYNSEVNKDSLSEPFEPNQQIYDISMELVLLLFSLLPSSTVIVIDTSIRNLKILDYTSSSLIQLLP